MIKNCTAKNSPSDAFGMSRPMVAWTSHYLSPWVVNVAIFYGVVTWLAALRFMLFGGQVP